jgi:hypothetical protein
VKSEAAVNFAEKSEGLLSQLAEEISGRLQ